MKIYFEFISDYKGFFNFELWDIGEEIGLKCKLFKLNIWPFHLEIIYGRHEQCFRTKRTISQTKLNKLTKKLSKKGLI